MIARGRDIFFKGVDMLKNKYITTNFYKKDKDLRRTNKNKIIRIYR